MIYLEVGSEPLVIVLNNAKYYSTLTEKEPGSLSTKTEIIDWINKKKTLFSSNEMRAELYEIVKRTKSGKTFMK